MCAAICAEEHLCTETMVSDVRSNLERVGVSLRFFSAQHIIIITFCVCHYLVANLLNNTRNIKRLSINEASIKL